MRGYLMIFLVPATLLAVENPKAEKPAVEINRKKLQPDRSPKPQERSVAGSFLKEPFGRNPKGKGKDWDLPFRKKEVEDLLGNAKQIGEWTRKLSNYLYDPDEEIRYKAVCALAEIGPSAQYAVSGLIWALSDKSSRIRAKAADALFYIGPLAEIAVPHLAYLLDDEVVEVQTRAAVALGQIGKGEKIAVPALINLFQKNQSKGEKTNKNLSCILAMALGKFGQQAAPAVPVLLENLKTENLEIRGSVIYALGKIRSNLPIVIPELQRILKDEREEALRRRVAMSLGDIGPEAKIAIPDLLWAFQCDGLKNLDLATDIRLGVLQALEGMGPGAESAVPAIIEICADKNMNLLIRNAALQTLGKIGPAAKKALPYLINSLNDKECPFNTNSMNIAFKGIGMESVRALIVNLINRPPGKKGRTILALGSLGPLAKEAVPFLEGDLANPQDAPLARIALQWIQKNRH